MKTAAPQAFWTGEVSSLPVPKFIVELEPRIPAFFGNLGVVLFPRRPTPLWITSRPGTFWTDVFVDQRLPLRGLYDSVAGHVLVLLSIYALAYYGFFGSRPQEIQNPLHKTITYYSVADYLPEVNSGSRPAQVELKGQPAYARQEIISVPPEPDNTRQTIVTPSNIKLLHDVPLPNIVAWNPALPSAPVSATPGRKLTITPTPEVIAPAPEAVTREGAVHMPNELMHVAAVPPEADLLSGRRLNRETAPSVVPPTVDANGLAKRPSIAAIDGPKAVEPTAEISPRKSSLMTTVPSVVEPTPDIRDATRRPGAMNMAKLAPGAAAPKLPVAEQRALGPGEAAGGSKRGDAGQVAAGGGTEAGGRQAPATAGTPAGAPASGQSSGQMIALSVDPHELKGPIEVPAGSRRGIFAAGPTGKVGAPGTPDIHKGSDGAGGTSTTKGAGTGSGSKTAPEGIYVGRGNAQTPPGAVVANKPADPAPGATRDPSFREKLMAAAREPAPDTGRQPTPGSTVNAPKSPIEEKVFGSKRYYSLTLNMPNLASTTGSWIIRFAELKQSHDDVPVSAPAVLTKVDPAYPAELVRDKVEGTVVLYAVIHSDGTIGEIKVLSGIEDALDQNAAKALAKWKFSPGMKNGQAIDLEAVVQIPFRVRKMAF